MPPPAVAVSAYTPLEQRWFGAVLFYTLVPVAILLVAAPPRAIEFWWDFAMALGILAASGLALLPLLSARWWAPQHRATGFLRLIQATHRLLAYLGMGLVLAHVGLLILLEKRVLEYLKLGAVAPMLAGMLGTLLGVFLILSSLYREAWGWPYKSWRRWHAGLSMMAVGCIGWHLIGAGYYYDNGSRRAALLWLLLVPTLAAWGLRRWPLHGTTDPAREPGHAARRRVQGLISAIALTWLAAALGFAWSGQFQPPLAERALCAIDPCL